MSLKKIGVLLKKVAPTIAGTLLTGGTSAAGSAIGAVVGDLLGVPDNTDTDAIAAKLADPVEFQRIKADLEKAELTHAQELAKQVTERLRITTQADTANFATAISDKGSARQMRMQAAGSDKTPETIIKDTYRLMVACLVGGVVVIFVGAYFKIEAAVIMSVNTVLSMVIGALLKQMSSQNDFFFGSSASSKAKTDIMAAELKSDNSEQDKK